MSELPLVSVITPCYNGEAFLDRYFQSVLSQSYPNIELIFVNDGSTDRSEEIALSYREWLEARGIRYLYIAQENKGISEAVNAGLRRFSGDYLTWPDSDDWMTPDCIAKKDYDGACDLLAELLAGDEEPIMILGLIGSQIRSLYAAKLAEVSGRGPAFAKEILGTNSDYRVRLVTDAARKFSLDALTRDVQLCAEYGMKTREQGAVLTDVEALKELLIRFAMENRHA